MYGDFSNELYINGAEDKNMPLWIRGLTIWITTMLLGNTKYTTPILLIMFLFFLNANIKKLPSTLPILIKNWHVALLILWCSITYTWSDYPEKTFVASVVQWVFFFTMILIVNAVKDGDWKSAFYKASKIVIVINTIWSILFFNKVMSHLGLMGFYNHKNQLGLFMMLSVSFLFLYRRTFDKRDLPYAIPGILLLLLSLSKTSIVLTLLIILTSKYWQKIKFSIRLPWQIIVIIFGTVSGLVIRYHSLLTDLLLSNLKDSTLTGRGFIWSSILQEYRASTLKGVGFEAFWKTGYNEKIQFVASYQENEYWLGRLTGADGGYIDIIITIGFIGLALLFASLTISFLKFMAIDRSEDNKRYFSLMFFLPILHNFTESTVLGYTGPIWFLLLFTMVMLSSIHIKKNSIEGV